MTVFFINTESNTNLEFRVFWQTRSIFNWLPGGLFDVREKFSMYSTQLYTIHRTLEATFRLQIINRQCDNDNPKQHEFVFVTPTNQPDTKSNVNPNPNLNSTTKSTL